MDQFFIALGFTLFGVMLAVVIGMLVMQRRPRRTAVAGAKVAVSSPAQEGTAPSTQPLRSAPSAVSANVERKAIGARAAEKPSGKPGTRDAVDPELFSVFEAETAELLQRIDADLRHWVQHPNNTAQRDAMQRALHMLKGSARVAGARQLGESAERMEAEIGALGRGPVALAGFQALLESFDTLQAGFGRLRAAGGVAAPAAIEAQRTLRPVVPASLAKVLAPLPEAVAAGGAGDIRRIATGHAAPVTLALPLAAASAQVVMLRAGENSIGISTELVESVEQLDAIDLARAYRRQVHTFQGEDIAFYWAGALLRVSPPARRDPSQGKNMVVIVRGGERRLALHVDEVLGPQELVVQNLGPQPSRLPGLSAISMLVSGSLAFICNPATLRPARAEAMQALVKNLPATAQPAGASAAAPAAQLPLILVVDDSITVQRVAQRLLQREGYRVALADDGLQALARLQEERPSVVLSDIEMPRMDGFDLARNIRADGTLVGLPIIMITSRIAEKHREHARQLGVNHYLGKPYAEEELIRLVRLYTGAAMTAAAAAA